MAKFPTYEEMGKKVAEKALDEFLYDGKSIREWMQIIASKDAYNACSVSVILQYAIVMKQTRMRTDYVKSIRER